MRTSCLLAVLLGACSFDAGGGGGDTDAGTPPAIDAAEPADASGVDPDAPVVPRPDADPSPDAEPRPDAEPPPDAEPSAIGLATTGSAAAIGDLGGSGGSPFTEDCPDGRVITGFFAKDNSFGLTRIGAMCSVLEIGPSGSVTTSDPQPTPTHGTETSVVDTPPRNCPGDSVVAGFIGTASSMDLVHSVTIKCADVTWDGTGYAVGTPTAISMALGSPSGFASDEADCPEGRVAGGFGRRAGTILDRFELRCFALAPVYP